jgi:hypothetical protein
MRITTYPRTYKTAQQGRPPHAAAVSQVSSVWCALETITPVIQVIMIHSKTFSYAGRHGERLDLSLAGMATRPFPRPFHPPIHAVYAKQARKLPLKQAAILQMASSAPESPKAAAVTAAAAAGTACRLKAASLATTTTSPSLSLGSRSPPDHLLTPGSSVSAASSSSSSLDSSGGSDAGHSAASSTTDEICGASGCSASASAAAAVAGCSVSCPKSTARSSRLPDVDEPLLTEHPGRYTMLPIQ